MNGSISNLPRTIAGRTVWSKGSRANIPERYQLIYGLVLPFKYAMIALYGAASIGAEVPSIDAVFGVLYGDIWSIALAASAITALLGIIFYDWLIWVEAVGSVLMVTLMVFYVVAIVLAAVTGLLDFRLLSLILVFVFLPMPSWRVWDIVRELRPARVLQ